MNLLGQWSQANVMHHQGAKCEVTPPRKQGGDPQPLGTGCPRKALSHRKVWGNVCCLPMGTLCGAASQCRQKGDTREVAGRGTGRGLAVLGHCHNSVLGPVAIGGAPGWTLVLLLWGPGAAPFCFCSQAALLLILLCWVSPRELELGTGIWPCGHPSQTGGSQNEQPSCSLAVEAGCGCRVPRGSLNPFLAAGSPCLPGRWCFWFLSSKAAPFPAGSWLHESCHARPRQGSALACAGSPSCR